MTSDSVYISHSIACMSDDIFEGSLGDSGCLKKTFSFSRIGNIFSVSFLAMHPTLSPSFDLTNRRDEYNEND